MLKRLIINNYALIDELEIDFEAGFSVMTGETGAGKSIILGALSLILGQRAEVKYIKQNETKCTIEGVFDISRYNLHDFFEEREWIYDDKECILRRELWSTGKSRAFVNDSPVYLNDLKELGDKLIDIHSQHQNLSLNDDIFQLLVVDLIADTKPLRNEYSHAYTAFRKAQKELEVLKDLSKRNREEEEYLRFQHKSLSEAKLVAGEQEELEEEQEAITHSEEIKGGLFTIINSLSEDEKSVESVLRKVLDSISGVQVVFPKIGDLYSRIDSTYIELKDIRSEAERLFEDIDFDQERQQFVEDRLSEIYNLQKKHSLSTVQELLELQEGISVKLENIDSLDEKILHAQKDLALKESAMLEAAKKLSNKRKSVTPLMEKQLIEKLTYLGMPNVRFKCSFTDKQPDSTGVDNVQFLFSANKNSAMHPVSQIASGGELSRFMLCIKSMIAGAIALPTIIFDEIDSGTSGEIADKMGRIMKQMSQEMQVVVITHLPQIASKGDSHYVVYKEDRENATHTYMRELTQEERVEEIARMLSGAETTSQAIENAKVMLTDSMGVK